MWDGISFSPEISGILINWSRTHLGTSQDWTSANPVDWPESLRQTYPDWFNARWRQFHGSKPVTPTGVYPSPEIPDPPRPGSLEWFLANGGDYWKENVKAIQSQQEFAASQPKLTENQISSFLDKIANFGKTSSQEVLAQVGGDAKKTTNVSIVDNQPPIAGTEVSLFDEVSTGFQSLFHPSEWDDVVQSQSIGQMIGLLAVPIGIVAFMSFGKRGRRF